MDDEMEKKLLSFIKDSITVDVIDNGDYFIIHLKIWNRFEQRNETIDYMDFSTKCQH